MSATTRAKADNFIKVLFRSRQALLHPPALPSSQQFRESQRLSVLITHLCTTSSSPVLCPPNLPETSNTSNI